MKQLQCRVCLESLDEDFFSLTKVFGTVAYRWRKPGRGSDRRA
jgi:hypothetical protein